MGRNMGITSRHAVLSHIVAGLCVLNELVMVSMTFCVIRLVCRSFFPSIGKKLLDDLKKKGEDLLRTNPRSDRLQPYKSQYMRLCKLYVDTMKEHQRSKVSVFRFVYAVL